MLILHTERACPSNYVEVAELGSSSERVILNSSRRIRGCIFMVPGGTPFHARAAIVLLDLRLYEGMCPRTWVLLFAVRNCARLRPGASIHIGINMGVKVSILGLGIMGAAMAP